MGRFYSGDIEGKFWFGVQDSDDASFFGGWETDVRELHYEFEEKDLPKIKKGIAECKEKLGEYEKKLDAFFKEKGSYNDEMIMKEMGVDKKKVATILKWYARLELGRKILDCVETQGHCYFDAEL